MNLLMTIISFIVALGVLIVFHEFGHYLVARLCGVRVLRFSVGFGRPIFVHRFEPRGTEWVIGLLPLGGYVKMLDEREGPVEPGDMHLAFNRKSVWQRIAIVAAGPVANFLLAIALYWLMFVSGVPDARPVIAKPLPGTPAASAGLHRGDTLLRINGEPVASWQEARWRLLMISMDPALIEVEVKGQDGRISTRPLDLRGFDLQGLEGDPVARIGVGLNRPDAVIGRLVPGGSGERAGLHAGDRIIEVDGAAISAWDEFVRAIRGKPGLSMQIKITNNSGESQMTLTPDSVTDRGRTIGRIGAEPLVNTEDMKNLFITVRHGPLDALGFAVAKTWDTSVFSVRMIGRMIVGEVSLKNISGPVTIADYAGQSAQAGWLSYLVFLAIVSISLGVLNLLPIPLLDGGHLMYYVAEIVIGRPVSDFAIDIGQRIGLAVLLMLMVFALYNDFNRLFSG